MSRFGWLPDQAHHKLLVRSAAWASGWETPGRRRREQTQWWHFAFREHASTQDEASRTWKSAPVHALMSSGVSPSHTSIRVRPFPLSTSNTAWWSQGESSGGHGGAETRWLAHFLNSAADENAGGLSLIQVTYKRRHFPKKRISASGGEQGATSATPIDDKIAAITLATDHLKASPGGALRPPRSAERLMWDRRHRYFWDLEFQGVLAITPSCKTNPSCRSRETVTLWHPT